MLRQLEGYRENPGGFGKQELEARIAGERAKLDEAEEAIRALKPVLAARSVVGATFDERMNHITDLGRQLNEKGGFELMKLVAYRCKARGSSFTYIEAAWDGIGEWKW